MFVVTQAVEAYPKEKSSELQSPCVSLSFLLALSHKLYPLPTQLAYWTLFLWLYSPALLRDHRFEEEEGEDR